VPDEVKESDWLLLVKDTPLNDSRITREQLLAVFKAIKASQTLEDYYIFDPL